MSPSPRPDASGPATHDPGKIAKEWWESLKPPSPDEPQKTRGDSGALARLRRAATPADAALEPATFVLMHRLGWPDHRWEPVATLAAILAHVREDQTKPKVAGQFGHRVDDRPVLSPARFQALIQAELWPDRMIALRRAIGLVEHRRINVVDLAESLLFWGERTRMEWVFAYHRAALPETAKASRTDNTAASAADLENVE